MAATTRAGSRSGSARMPRCSTTLARAMPAAARALVTASPRRRAADTRRRGAGRLRRRAGRPPRALAAMRTTVVPSVRGRRIAGQRCTTAGWRAARRARPRSRGRPRRSRSSRSWSASGASRSTRPIDRAVPAVLPARGARTAAQGRAARRRPPRAQRAVAQGREAPRPGQRRWYVRFLLQSRRRPEPARADRRRLDHPRAQGRRRWRASAPTCTQTLLASIVQAAGVCPRIERACARASRRATRSTRAARTSS